MHEKESDAARFDRIVRKVLSVPHSEIMRREEEYQKRSAANPHRRGPKRKAPASTPAPDQGSTPTSS